MLNVRAYSYHLATIGFRHWVATLFTGFARLQFPCPVKARRGLNETSNQRSSSISALFVGHLGSATQSTYSFLLRQNLRLKHYFIPYPCWEGDFHAASSNQYELFALKTRRHMPRFQGLMDASTELLHDTLAADQCCKLCHANCHSRRQRIYRHSHDGALGRPGARCPENWP